MNTLLFATDLSVENRAAFGRALRLALAADAQLDILHVIDPYLPRRVLPSIEAAVAEDIATRMTDLREDYALEAPRTRVQTATGSPYVEIVREAFEHQAALVVLGMHRKRGQPAFLEGTTALRVATDAPCPVVIASALPVRAWEEILIPVDASVSVTNVLGEVLARFPAARITLLHAWALPGEAELGSDPHYAKWREGEVARLQAALDAQVAELDVVTEQAVEVVLEQGDPVEVVGTYVKRHLPDLVLLSGHALPRAARTLSRALLSEPHTDLMVHRL
ncbi:universal stress protein [Halomonas dongshanensis]|nr:universal stress protein [Halomonas dongshanensis]